MSKNTNIDSFDFDEKFSKDDVIASFSGLPDDEDDEQDSEKSNLIEVEDLINYNEELHKEKLFKYEYNDDYELAEEDRLKDTFRDFLNVPKISGLIKGYSDNNKIPFDKIKKSQKHIEIKDIPSDDKDFENQTGHYSTVILHKNELDEITSIDVVCSCGTLTKVQFDYGTNDSSPVNSVSNIIVKDSSKDPSLISTDKSAKMMESPDNFDEDYNYEASLMEKFEDYSSVFPELDNSEEV